jgi:hypothetical protein
MDLRSFDLNLLVVLPDGATGRLRTRQGCDSRQIAGKKIGIDALLTQKQLNVTKPRLT